MSDVSLNVWTTKGWSLPEAIDGCVRHGIGGIGLWRDKVAETGLDRAAKLIAASSLTVTSLCRGGFFTTTSTATTSTATTSAAPTSGTPADDNRRAVDEAAERGIKLAIEPLHPMFCADRAVVSTLGQALDMCDLIGADNVGVCVDTYHVWWDPQVYDQIARAGERTFLFQVCDFLVPVPADILLGRGHVGDGVIDIPALAMAVAAAGYDGFTEVEIFNQRVWDTPGDETLRTIAERDREYLS
jgi:sugar phosphate isomerase/epimerase